MSKTCPVCFNEANYTTRCKHHFCKKCLYYWGESCPLCRRFIVLDYPNTRAMSTQQSVVDNTSILINNIVRTGGTKYKIKRATQLMQYLWDNRVVIRKYGRLCKAIRAKSIHIRKACVSLGLMPPKILKKTKNI